MVKVESRQFFIQSIDNQYSTHLIKQKMMLQLTQKSRYYLLLINQQIPNNNNHTQFIQNNQKSQFEQQIKQQFFKYIDKRELLLTQNHQIRKSQSQNLKIKIFL
ncbi:hypothetical protein ABPG74_015065 [Tetrahymena malaccensis]